MTTAQGIWLSFTVVVVVYAALGVGTVLVLRAMSRRWRREDLADHEVPYGPPPPPGDPHDGLAPRPGGS